MEPRVSLVTLGVRDLARARSFYCEGLGWPASSQGDDEVVFIKTTSGSALALYGRDQQARDAGLEPEHDPASSDDAARDDAARAPRFEGIALAHNVREAAEVDHVLETAEAAGARILRRASSASWGGRIGYFADPDGHVWEVAWNPGFPFRSDGSVEIPD